MNFVIALQFLTMIPVTINRAVKSRDIARAMAYFPVIGMMIGVLTAAVYTLLTPVLAEPVCDLMAIVFMIMITGNMHGDGLMDSADGLFSGKPRERVLEIMRDSRNGSHGVTAGVVVILARFVLLGQIAPEFKWQALVLIPAVGRWAQVYCATLYDYARTGGGTGGFTEYVGFREITWASLTVLIPVILLLKMNSVIVVGFVLAGTAFVGWYMSRKIGGVTGDTLGAINELAEVFALLALQIIL